MQIWISWDRRLTTRVLYRRLFYKCAVSVRVETAAEAYLLSISEIVNNVQRIGTGALLIVTNYVLGLIWGNDSIYVFDLHSKDEIDNESSCVRAVCLKFDILHSLENYVRSVYDNAYLLTLYIQIQFRKFHCPVNARSTIKFALKKELFSAK